MFAQRVGVMALRRAAAKPTTAITSNVARALAIRSAMAAQTRPITTEKLSQTQGEELLAAQRLRRPVSPHLEIYDPAQVWYGASIMQRFTGMAYGGALYGGALAYLAAPLLGWHVESASIVAAFAGLPVVAKGAIKFALAWPLVFHGFNGTRHLVWDFLVAGFTRPEIAKTTKFIWIGSVLTSLGLAFLL